MRKMKIILPAVLLSSLAVLALADEAPKSAEPGTLVLVDSAGKEQKLKSWKFTAGVQKLTWLAPAEKAEDKPAKDKDKAKAEDKAKPEKSSAVPEALLVRDELQIHFLAGVTTFAPLERIRSISFDPEKETMTVRVATSDKPEQDITLTGTTKYKGINKLTLTADVDKGEDGVATLTYQGGVPRGNLKEVRFGAPKAPTEKPGRPAVVVTTDQDVKKTHQVSDLEALYRLESGGEKTLPTLMFKKTLKINLAKVKKIAAGADDSDDIVWQVTRKDGEEANYTLLESATVNGGKARLIGLVGRVPAGYKLFPLRRITSIQFDTSEAPRDEKKDEEKKDEEKKDKD
jgi:hypothetical protein